MWFHHLFTTSSAVSLVPLVLLCLQCCLLICVIGELRKMPESNLTKTEINSFETTHGKLGLSNIIFAKRKSSPQTAQKYLVTLLIFGIVSTALAAHAAIKQRGYCIATGDFAESDHMTVVAVKDGWFEVLGKDGRAYQFYPCPPSKMGWKEGTVIEFARYELRDGCADFSSPLASVVAH